MTRSRLFLSATALGGALLLSACGSDDGTATASTSGPSTSAPAPATPAPATPAVGGGADPAAGGGIQAAADVEFEDQSGPGDSVVVQRVSLSDGGFVVVTVDDDDDDDARDDAGTVLGATPVAGGTSTDVVVALDPRLDRETDLEATLWADTDGNGAFDAATDQRVAEPQDDDDDEDDEVSDDAEYSVR